MNISKTTWWMIGGATVAIVSIGVFTFLNKKKKNTIIDQKKSKAPQLGNGITITRSNTGVTKQVPNWNNPFDMNYLNDVKQWLTPKNIIEMNVDTAKKYAVIIKKAKGTFNDDEIAVKTIFSKHLKDKTNIASLSKAFWSLYKKDMWQHLTSFLSESEMNQYVHQFIKQLPNYTTA